MPGSTIRHSSSRWAAAESSLTCSLRPGPCGFSIAISLGGRAVIVPASVVEGLDSGLRAAEDQRVDVVGAFVGVHHLQVHHVADDAELIRDAIATEHVASGARDIECLAAGVPLHD